MQDGQGASVAVAELTQEGSMVRVEIQSRNLPPGPHAVHLHAVGRCDPPDFASAGGHVNPDNRQHGAQNPQGPHAGDLPNLEVNQQGRGNMDTSTDRVTLTAGPKTLLDADGSALVIHAGADDERTDPDGGAGERIACGVIALD
jgi:Cu-Zn family superoxide dismutase